MKYTYGSLGRRDIGEVVRDAESDKSRTASSSSGSGPPNANTNKNVHMCRVEYEKLLTHQENATSFRETFSLLKEASIKAMAAIDMCLHSNDDVEPHLSRACSELNAALTKATTLVLIHGKVSVFKKVIHQSARVRDRCHKVIRQLEAIAEDAWDLREAGGAYRRQRPDSSSLRSGARSMKFLLLPKTIFKGGKSKIRCLEYAPNEDLDDDGQAKGTVWWGVDSCLFRHDLQTGATTSINPNLVGSPVLCITCDENLRIWTGHNRGEVKCWNSRTGKILASCQSIDDSIRSLVVDSSLAAWAGFPSGKIVRFKTYRKNGQLQIGVLGSVAPEKYLDGGILKQLKRVYSKNTEESAHSGRVRTMLARETHVWSSGGDRRQSSCLRVWNMHGMEVAATPLSTFGICDAMLDIAWNEDKQSALTEKWRLLTGHETGELVLWLPLSLEPMVKIGPQSAPVRSIMVVNCLGLLLTAHQDGRMTIRKELVPDKSSPGMFSTCEDCPPTPCMNEVVNEHLPPFGGFQAHKSRMTSARIAVDIVYTASGRGVVSCWPLSVLERQAIMAGIEPRIPECSTKTLRRDRTLKWLNRTTPVMPSFKHFNAPLLEATGSSSAGEELIGDGSGTIESPSGQTDSEHGGSSDNQTEGHHTKSWSSERRGGHRAIHSTIDLNPVAADLEAPTAKLFVSRSCEPPQTSVEQLDEMVQREHSAPDLDRGMNRCIINANDLEFEENPHNSLGSGAFGVVYKGKAYMTDVAIKVLQQDSLMHQAKACELWNLDASLDDGVSIVEQKLGEEELKGLKHEASLMYQLRHPNVVMFLGVCLNPPALVTEYCAKGSLFNLLQNARVSSEKKKLLSWKRVLTMAVQAALGMHYLHRHNVEHRDLKSPNLLVTENWVVKVADFGTSKFMLSEKQWSESMHASNPLWLAPESLQNGKYGFKADVYSFGIVLWELLTWQTPWEDYCGDRGCHPVQIWNWVVEGSRPRVPDENSLPAGPLPVFEEYTTLMQKCWSQNPDDRPEFQGIASTLEAMLNEIKKREPSKRPKLTVRIQEYSRGPSSPPPPQSPFMSSRGSTPTAISPVSPRKPPTSPFVSPTAAVPEQNGEDTQLRSPLPAPPSPFNATQNQKMSGRLAATPSAAFMTVASTRVNSLQAPTVPSPRESLSETDLKV